MSTSEREAETVEPRRRTKPAEQRRTEILSAALKSFRERGYNETTVQHIADAAGIAIGTLYIHYSSKEQILVALHESFHNGLAEEMAQIAGDLLESRPAGSIDLREAVDVCLDVTARYMTNHVEECEIVMRYLPQGEVMRSEKVMVELLTRLIEEGVREGVAHSSDPEMTARLMNAAVGFTTGSAVAFGDADLDRLIASAKEFFYKALLPPKS